MNIAAGISFFVFSCTEFWKYYSYGIIKHFTANTVVCLIAVFALLFIAIGAFIKSRSLAIIGLTSLLTVIILNYSGLIAVLFGGFENLKAYWENYEAYVGAEWAVRIAIVIAYLFLLISVISKKELLGYFAAACFIANRVIYIFSLVPPGYRLKYLFRLDTFDTPDNLNAIIFAVGAVFLAYCFSAKYQAAKSASPSVRAPSNSSNTLDALLRLKELLDSGIITQEEFDAKKKQLLEV